MSDKRGEIVAQGAWVGEPRVHYLKTWPEYYKAVIEGRKRFELRRADRPFRVGDLVCLKEYRGDIDEFSGRYTVRRITYIMEGDGSFALRDGYCVLGIGGAEIPL